MAVMKVNHWLFLLFVGFIDLAPQQALALAQRQISAVPRLLVSHENIFTVGEVEQVMEGHIRWFTAAPLGRFTLIAQRRETEPDPTGRRPFGSEKLWLYDSQLRKVALLFEAKDTVSTAQRQFLGNPTWFSDGKTALFPVLTGKHEEDLEMTMRYALVNIEKASLRWLELPETYFWRPQAIPKNPQLFLRGYNRHESESKPSYALLSSEGKSTPLTQTDTLDQTLKGLSADGKSAIFYETFPLPENGQPPKPDRWAALELSRAQFTPLTQKPANLQSLSTLTTTKKPELKTQNTWVTLTVASGRTKDVPALWVEAAQTSGDKHFARTLVTLGANGNLLLPDLTAVLFTQNGGLYTLPLHQVAESEIKTLAQRNYLESLTAAKFVGVALMEYAKAHKDNLPPHSPHAKELLLPYLRNRQVLADFVYTYQGATALTKFKNPETVPVGYVPILASRILIYADGHVGREKPE
jgi:hypothetical protein